MLKIYCLILGDLYKNWLLEPRDLLKILIRL